MPELVTLVLVAAAGIADLRTGKIFNYLTYPAILWGLGSSLAAARLPLLEPVSITWPSAVAGFVVAFGGFLTLFLIGWMGGGDVKLMGAVGALMGYPFVLHAMFYSIFFGGVAALVLLIWRGELVRCFREMGRYVAETVTPGFSPVPLEPIGGSIPFGVAISFGTMVALALKALAGS